MFKADWRDFNEMNLSQFKERMKEAVLYIDMGLSLIKESNWDITNNPSGVDCKKVFDSNAEILKELRK